MQVAADVVARAREDAQRRAAAAPAAAPAAASGADARVASEAAAAQGATARPAFAASHVSKPGPEPDARGSAASRRRPPPPPLLMRQNASRNLLSPARGHFASKGAAGLGRAGSAPAHIPLHVVAGHVVQAR